MKTILIITLTFINHIVIASTQSEAKIKLNYNFYQYSENSLNYSDFPYLNVSLENLNFPPKNKGKLGEVQKYKLLKAIKLIEIILNSKEFRKRVISYSGSKGKCKNGYCYTGNYLWKNKKNKLSNLEIYSIILNGNEKTRPNTENEANINIKWARMRRRIIGRTKPSTSKWIEVNWRKYYWNYNTPQMVNNIVHEWIHLLGFSHTKKRYIKNNPSYVIGKIAKKMAIKLVKQEKK